MVHAMIGQRTMLAFIRARHIPSLSPSPSSSCPLLLALLLLAALAGAGQGRLMDTCEIRPRQVTLNPDAEAFIGE
ncbi:hypothetical protein E2C01_068069 [Portunus trituberculatus]|uniref:Uncharacterized protein n=1 Tax=Portunus trituberculatus TaxID=210409 RepID=A0A5B7HR12_PORTR|nr:hypothetical protein [Portunus trituberculatus]